jgi:hypothetical protein
MMKKIIGILICMMMLSTIPVVVGNPTDSKPKIDLNEEPSSLVGITFVAGYVLNPTETVLGRINANAIALLYYDRGIIQRDTGIVTGFRKVSFKESPLMIMNEQGSMGLTLVIGICSGFRIGL